MVFFVSALGKSPLKAFNAGVDAQDIVRQASNAVRINVGLRALQDDKFIGFYVKVNGTVAIIAQFHVL
jgi:hypothetical protein